MYDPMVLEAARAYAAETGKPGGEVSAEIQTYAREIVPAFNAYLYFRVGNWLARKLTLMMYRVRIGFTDEAALAAAGSNRTVVFVMNHRSNMDYVLVGYLSADLAALSYAVGEWARVWPLQTLIRAMGAYFIRRNSNDSLYRRVLERYVHIATENGVPQAVFPEGGLTVDGLLRPPKLGLLDYLIKSFDPVRSRDIMFIPVGINYDRVLEDRSLLRKLDKNAPRRSEFFAARTALKFFVRAMALGFMGRWYRFGYACVNFGAPVSLRSWLVERRVDLRDLSKEDRFKQVAALAEDLMGEIGGLIPVLPVALVATVMLREQRPLDELELKAAVHGLIGRLESAKARVYIPRGNRDYAVTVGLRMLALRRLIVDNEGFYQLVESETPVLRYYANSIAHLVDRA